jgi:tetratricopeptide (TPR) repeat protein
MYLNRALILTLATLMVCASALAAEIESIQQATRLSAQQGKPLLLEFYRSDCEYCERSEREAEQNSMVQAALRKVVHYHVNVKEGEGPELKERYQVGYTYPVFVLANSDGEPISRWVGFTHGSRFVTRLTTAMRDLTTVAERRERLETSPTLTDALFLAGYSAEIAEYDKSADYYRQAQELGGPRMDYSYNIFYQSANAAWNEMIPFSAVTAAADSALASDKTARDRKIKIIQLLARLARQQNQIDQLIPYLDKGVKLTGEGKDPGVAREHAEFLAERTLYVDHDTTATIAIKRQSQPDGWRSDPKQCYEYAKWFLERRINLPEAEQFARFAAERVAEGKPRAMVLSTVAEICAEQGKYSEAVDVMLKAVEHDPTRESYHTQLKQYNDELEDSG